MKFLSISSHRINIRIAIWISLSALCSGCGTAASHLFTEPPHKAYPGVRSDVTCMVHGAPGWILDLPFSAAADTILLPMDVWPETKDPLKTGWTYFPLPDSEPSNHGQNTNHLDQAIVDDYKSYMAKNQLYQESKVAGFYEDGKGWRAVKFEAYGDHETASYVLIYDTKNKRVKVVIFNPRRSMC